MPPLAPEFHPEASAEFTAAVEWYEGERPGLGAAFAAAVQQTVHQAAETPLAGAPVGAALRRVLVPAFPYAVWYAVEPTRLWIVAVAHFRRRPGYWRHRR